MSERQSIKQRWPDKHIARSTVWFPNPDKPGQHSSRVEIETWLPKPVAELVVSLLALGNGLEGDLLRECEMLQWRIQREGKLKNRVKDFTATSQPSKGSK